jgi:amidase
MTLPGRLLRFLAFTLLHRDDPSGRHIGLASNMSARRYLNALAEREALIEQMESFLQKWHGFLCPVSATPAFTHRRPSGNRPPPPIMVDGKPVPYWVAATGHTMVFNLTGNPSVVLPAARDDRGLPVGLQVVSRRWDDARLLSMAIQIESVLGGFRQPDLSWHAG